MALSYHFAPSAELRQDDGQSSSLGSCRTRFITDCKSVLQCNSKPQKKEMWLIRSFVPLSPCYKTCVQSVICFSLGGLTRGGNLQAELRQDDSHPLEAACGLYYRLQSVLQCNLKPQNKEMCGWIVADLKFCASYIVFCVCSRQN